MSWNVISSDSVMWCHLQRSSLSVFSPRLVALSCLQPRISLIRAFLQTHPYLVHVRIPLSANKWKSLKFCAHAYENLRKNAFSISTDFYHLFQSTKKKDLWTNLRMFPLLGSATNPPLQYETHSVSCAQSELFWLLTPPPVGFQNLLIFRNSGWATLHACPLLQIIQKSYNFLSF